MIRGLASLPYDQRLQRINLISLEMRRQRADLIEVYKVMHGLEDLPSDLLFKINSGRTRVHHIGMVKKSCSSQHKKMLFLSKSDFFVEFSSFGDSESVNEF